MPQNERFRAPPRRSGPRRRPHFGYGASTLTEPVPLVQRIDEELDLLSRNYDILTRVERIGPVGLIRLATMMQLPIHKVRYSMHLLEQEGLVRATPLGAVATKRARAYRERLIRTLEQVEVVVETLRERRHERPRRSGESGA